MTQQVAQEILSNPRAALTYGWHLDGAGPARYGWAYQHPCRVEFVARTLADCKAKAEIVLAGGSLNATSATYPGAE